MTKYSRISPEKKNCAIYYKNVVGKFNFYLDENYITNANSFNIEIKVHYANSFEYELNYLDTIICLPKIFGDSAEKMQYIINLHGFPSKNDFYFFTYSICGNKLKYNINDIPNMYDKKNESFIVEYNPKSTRDEKAFYFTIGIHDTDKESKFQKNIYAT